MKADVQVVAVNKLGLGDGWLFLFALIIWSEEDPVRACSWVSWVKVRLLLFWKVFEFLDLGLKLWSRKAADVF